MKLKVPLIPRGIPSEKEPWPIGSTRKTADPAVTSAKYARMIHGRIESLKENSHSLPIQQFHNLKKLIKLINLIILQKEVYLGLYM